MLKNNGFHNRHSPILRAFSPASLFSSGAPGAWYDPSDLTTLFQDSAGTTPVTAVEQPVGLMLDKSQGLVLGSEICPNGTFDAATGWVLTAGTTISGGKLNFSAAAPNNPNAYIALTGAASGDVYSITFTITDYVTGAVGVRLYSSGTVSPSYSANGTYTVFLAVPVSNGNFGFVTAGASTTLSIDNVSVKKVLGNHAFQSTSASRPVLSARYNLLTKTDQFNDAAWVKTNVTVTTNTIEAPDGTLTADTLTAIAANGNIRNDPLRTGEITSSIYVKRKTGTGSVQLLDAAGTYRTVTVTSEWTNVDYTAVATGPSLFGIRLTVSGDEIYIWAASAVPTNQSTLPYQRVNTATDYNTTGFLPYLKFDGVDDSLSTNSISFTATDKMSVFAGVRKLSDAATGLIAEFSVNANASFGSFYFAAPNNTGTSGNYGFTARGTVGLPVGVSSGVVLSPNTSVIVGTADISGDVLALRRNGVLAQAVSVDLGTGNFGNYPLYIGRRGGSSLPFNGQMYSMIIVGKAVTAGELSSTETYVNQKTGAY